MAFENLPLLGQTKLTTKLEEVGELLEPAGTAEFKPKSLGVDSGDQALTIFDQPLTLKGTMAAEVGLLGDRPEQRQVQLFGAEKSILTGDNVAFLRLNGQVGAKTSAKKSTLQAGLSAAASFRYDHYLPVRANDRRFDAFRKVVVESGLPANLKLDMLDEGEAHVLETGFQLGFDVAAEFTGNATAALADGLWQGVSQPLQVAGGIAVKAALGLTLDDTMRLVIARVDLHAPERQKNWVRLRLERKNAKRLTFAASIALQQKFQLGSTLVSILERTLERAGWSELMATVGKLRGHVAPLAAGNWDAVKAKLSGRALELAEDLMDDALAQPEVAKALGKLVEGVQDLQSAYAQLDDEIADFWDHLLDKAHLGEESRLEAALKKIVNEEISLDKLIDDQGWREHVDLLELLAGESLEEALLSADDKIAAFSVRAKAKAQKALDFLTSLRNLDQGVAAKLDEFLERQGVVALLGKLNDFAGSKEQLAAALGKRLKHQVEKLVDKAWDQISAEDLKKVQVWAKRVDAVLAKPEELQEKLSQTLKKLDFELSFSIGFEVDRLVRREAIIDVELDPKLDGEMRKLLRRGDASGFLRALVEDDNDRQILNEKAKDHGEISNAAAKGRSYYFRECLFLTQKSRLAAHTAFLSLLGLGRAIKFKYRGHNLRSTEARLSRVNDQPWQGRYVGSYERSEAIEEGGTKWSSKCAVSLRLENSAKVDLVTTFDQALVARLGVRFERHDQTIDQARLDGLDRLFARLQLGPDQPSAKTTLGQEVEVELAFELPGEALAVFGKTTDPEWQGAFFAAARVWLEDPFVVSLNAKEIRDLVADPAIRKALRDNKSAKQLRDWAIANGRHDLAKSNKFLTRLGLFLYTVGYYSHQGQEPLRDLELPTQATPAAYEQSAETFADAWRKAALQQESNWPSSLFVLWLLLARLAQANAPELGQARGFARLRTRASSTAEWSTFFWRIDGLAPEPLRVLFGFGPI